MGVNFVVKPIATYAGVSDTNGGGYVDGYDATYANFCTANGGPTTVFQFSEVSETGGVYSFTFTSGTGSNYIAGQLCYIEHPGYGFWYGRVVATYPADVLRVVYVPVNGGTGYLSEASIATLITNNMSAGEITIGGALATIEAGANLAKVDGYTLMIEGPATYTRTAGITDIVNLIVMSVDSNGVEAIGDNRPEEDLATNSVQYGWSFAAGGGNVLRLASLAGEIYSQSSTLTGLVYLPDTNNRLYLNKLSYTAAAENNSWVVAGANEGVGYYGAVNNCSFAGTYGYTYGSSYKYIATVTSSFIVTTVLMKGLHKGAPFYNFASCVMVIGTIALNVSTRDDSQKFQSCLIINKNLTGNFIDYSQTAKNVLHSCVIIGWDKIFNSVTADTVGIAVNCAIYDSDWGDALVVNGDGNIELSADPFVDSTNGDYRLDPAGPDFDKLYDTLNGRVMIGATGPEMTTGGGGGISSARYIGGV